MSKCKICNEECQWVFCSDCEKLIGNGLDELESQLATVTAERDELIAAALPREGNCGFGWNLETGEPYEKENACLCCDSPLIRVRKIIAKMKQIEKLDSR